jgi:hypothetical protein
VLFLSYTTAKSYCAWPFPDQWPTIWIYIDVQQLMATMCNITMPGQIRAVGLRGGRAFYLSYKSAIKSTIKSTTSSSSVRLLSHRKLSVTSLLPGIPPNITAFSPPYLGYPLLFSTPAIYSIMQSTTSSSSAPPSPPSLRLTLNPPLSQMVICPPLKYSQTAILFPPPQRRLVPPCQRRFTPPCQRRLVPPPQRRLVPPCQRRLVPPCQRRFTPPCQRRLVPSP